MSLAARHPRVYGSVRPTSLGIWIPVLAQALALAACGPGCDLNDNTFHVEGRGPSAPPPKSAYGFRYPPQPPIMSVPDLESLVAAYGRRHRVVLLEVWSAESTSGHRGIEELAQLQSELGRDRFQVVSVNLDPAERWSARTAPILQAAHANFPCIVIDRANRAALRSWLDSDWEYDLPARFLIDRQGKVLERLVGGAAMARVRDAVRGRVEIADRTAFVAVEERPVLVVRTRLISVRDGKARTLPDVTADDRDPEAVADEVCRQVTRQLDPARTPRIAVLGFARAGARQRPDAFGHAAASALVNRLRRGGFYDLVAPERTARWIDELGLTAMAIDFEPALLTGRIDADYLILGWLIGGDRPNRRAAEWVADRNHEP